jgi:hypothetical protein
VIAPARDAAGYGAGAADQDGVRRFRFGPVLAGTVLTVLLLWLAGTAAEVFLLLFIAILLSLYLGAAADALRRRVPMPRGVALALAGALSVGAVVGLVWLLVPPVIAQTQALIRVLPDYVNAWDAGIDRIARGRRGSPPCGRRGSTASPWRCTTRGRTCSRTCCRASSTWSTRSSTSSRWA